MDRDKAIRYMHDLLRTMVQKGGSDLFITAGAPPSIKVDGAMDSVSSQKLSPQHTQVLVRSLMNDKQSAEFDATQECNFAISLPGVSTFSCQRIYPARFGGCCPAYDSVGDSRA